MWRKSSETGLVISGDVYGGVEGGCQIASDTPDLITAEEASVKPVNCGVF